MDPKNGAAFRKGVPFTIGQRHWLGHFKRRSPGQTWMEREGERQSGAAGRRHKSWAWASVRHFLTYDSRKNYIRIANWQERRRWRAWAAAHSTWLNKSCVFVATATEFDLRQVGDAQEESSDNNNKINSNIYDNNFLNALLPLAGCHQQGIPTVRTCSRKSHSRRCLPASLPA